jgi:hypothetical protein
MRILFPNRKVEAVAELLETQAPRTCDAVWDALPFEGEALHAKWAGHEIWTAMPAIPLPGPENQTIFPLPGDVLFFHFPGASYVGEDVYDFALFYDRDSVCFGPQGFIPGNRFAAVVDNLEGLQEACRRIHREGSEAIRVERR